MKISVSPFTLLTIPMQKSVIPVADLTAFRYHPIESNYEVCACIVKHNYILGGMLFTICKSQLHVSATNVDHLQVVQ
jgi:hypothetical protein